MIVQLCKLPLCDVALSDLVNLLLILILAVKGFQHLLKHQDKCQKDGMQISMQAWYMPQVHAKLDVVEHGIEIEIPHS